MMNEQNNPYRLYEIKVEGHLDERWQAWFDGLTLTHTADGCTILQGAIHDQAALHGALRRISNLGLNLISVNSHDMV